MTPRAAVIGSTGFLGRALLTRLRTADVDVTEFTRHKPFIQADTAPAPALLDADVVYYLASAMTPATAERDPSAPSVELERLQDLIRCLDQSERNPLLVLPSSGGTVYDTTLVPPYDEASPTGPRGRFGAAKVEMERVVLAMGRSHRPVVLRISNAYGPGQRPASGQGVIAHWLYAAAQGDPLVAIGDLETTRDYVYVDDVVDAFAALLTPRDEIPSVMNIGSGTPTSLRELIALVREVVGDVEMGHEPARSFDVSRTWLVVDLAKEALSWSPSVSLHEGIERAWSWVRSESEVR